MTPHRKKKERPTPEQKHASRYSRALIKRIAAQVANGATLSDIAADINLPPGTIYSWLSRHAEFKELYEQAVNLRNMVAEDSLHVLCNRAHTVAADSGEARLQLEAIKLEIDTRKWLLSKLMPRKYGDKSQLEVTGKDGESLLPQHTREQDIAYLTMLAEVQKKTMRE